MTDETDRHWLLGEFADRHGSHPLASFTSLFPMPFLLEVFHHDRNTWEDLRLFPLTGSFGIGRDAASFMRIDAPSVSSHHAEIHEPKGKSDPWQLRNLAGNRTLRNAAQVEVQEPLQDMDLLTFGDGVRYVFILAPTFHHVLRCTASPLDEELIAFLEGRAPAAPAKPVICPGVLSRVRCLLRCGPGHEIALEPGKKLLIGRNGASDLKLDDPSVSRAHATFQCNANGAVIQDLCSANGTRVDGTAIGQEPIRLLPNQQVQVGPFNLTLDAECPHADPPDAEGEASP